MLVISRAMCVPRPKTRNPRQDWRSKGPNCGRNCQTREDAHLHLQMQTGAKSRCARSDWVQLGRSDSCRKFWDCCARSRSESGFGRRGRSENCAHGSTSERYFSSPYHESTHLLMRYQRPSPQQGRGPLRGLQHHIPRNGCFLSAGRGSLVLYLRTPWDGGKMMHMGRSSLIMPSITGWSNVATKDPRSPWPVTLADWTFHRIPIERPDRFLPAPTATGTKVQMDTPLVKEVIELERWMRTTMFIEMGGKVYWRVTCPDLWRIDRTLAQGSVSTYLIFIIAKDRFFALFSNIPTWGFPRICNFWGGFCLVAFKLCLVWELMLFMVLLGFSGFARFQST